MQVSGFALFDSKSNVLQTWPFLPSSIVYGTKPDGTMALCVTGASEGWTNGTYSFNAYTYNVPDVPVVEPPQDVAGKLNVLGIDIEELKVALGIVASIDPIGVVP